MQNETGFSLCATPEGRVAAGPVVRGTPNSVNVPIACPPGADFFGLYHTHPGGVPEPSPKDMQSAAEVGASVSCINADGVLRCYPVAAGMGRRGRCRRVRLRRR